MDYLKLSKMATDKGCRIYKKDDETYTIFDYCNEKHKEGLSEKQLLQYLKIV
jgi:hypothetical protein